MKIWKVILATLVIFSAGVLAGARLMQLRHAHSHNVAVETPVSKPAFNLSVTNNPVRGTNHDTRLAMPGIRPPGRNLGKEFLERLDREIKLDPDQRQQIEKILEASQKRAREIWRQVEPQWREEMSQTREQIRATLTPEQAARFEELMKRAPKPLKEEQTTNAVTASPTNSEVAPASQPPSPANP